MVRALRDNDLTDTLAADLLLSGLTLFRW